MTSAYETLRVLGRGSYGTAVLARSRKQAEEMCVLKEVDISQMSPEACQQARKEVEVLRSLQHVNIVAYWDTFVESGRLHIVMEYADGGNLAEAIKSCQNGQTEKFTEDKAISIFAQACLALQHIHSKHVLHRDLKSQNIFLTQQGIVKLGDFGIAKILDATDAEAITVIGTPSYLAPEVCDSQPYGTKADVWSLGVVLYEMLTLELPFKARSLAALVVKIVTCKLCPVSPDLCSLEARQLIRMLLRKKPEKRLAVDEIVAVPIVSHAVDLLGGASPDESEGSTRATSRPTSTDSYSSRESKDRPATTGMSVVQKQKVAPRRSSGSRGVPSVKKIANGLEQTLAPISQNVSDSIPVSRSARSRAKLPSLQAREVCASNASQRRANQCIDLEVTGDKCVKLSSRNHPHQLPLLPHAQKEDLLDILAEALEPSARRTGHHVSSARRPRRLSSLSHQPRCGQTGLQEENGTRNAQGSDKRPSSTPCLLGTRVSLERRGSPQQSMTNRTRSRSPQRLEAANANITFYKEK